MSSIIITVAGACAEGKIITIAVSIEGSKKLGGEMNLQLGRITDPTMFFFCAQGILNGINCNTHIVILHLKQPYKFHNIDRIR